MTSEERKSQLNLYASAYDLLVNALYELPREMWNFKPSPDKWSIHEIVIHITDSEVNSYIRCRCFIAEPGKTIMAYNQDLWATRLNYHQRSIDEALALFKFLRETSYEIIKDLSSEIWYNTINHPENGLMTMDDWLLQYADHIPVHIKQMKRVFSDWKKKTASQGR